MRKARAAAGSVVFLAVAPGLVPWWLTRWQVEEPFRIGYRCGSQV